MPMRQFTRSRKAWYDTINQTDSEPEEFMLSFTFQDGEAGDSSLYGEIALRYHPAVSGWRLEAYDDSLLLVSQFSDVIEALGANPTSFDADNLEKLLKQVGVLDKTARAAPENLKGHPGLKR